MACCGRTRPLGAETQKAATTKTTATKTTTTSTSKTPPAPAPQRKPTTASSFQTFTLEQRDGSTQTFGSRLEAEAARIRTGGSGIVR